MAKRSIAKNPYILIVGVMALADAVWGRHIQAWIMTLPDNWRYVPFIVVMIVLAAAFLTIAYFNNRNSDA